MIMKRIAVCSGGVQIQEIQIDGLKSQLNNKQINFSDDNYASINECLLRCISSFKRGCNFTYEDQLHVYG